jgi:hypothetical protein
VNSNGSGTLSISSVILGQIDANHLYEVRFYKGDEQEEGELIGVSQPFYRL